MSVNLGVFIPAEFFEEEVFVDISFDDEREHHKGEVHPEHEGQHSIEDDSQVDQRHFCCVLTGEVDQSQEDEQFGCFGYVEMGTDVFSFVGLTVNGDGEVDGVYCAYGDDGVFWGAVEDGEHKCEHYFFDAAHEPEVLGDCFEVGAH